MHDEVECFFQAKFLPAIVQFCGSVKDKRDWVKAVSIEPMPGGRGVHIIASNTKCIVVIQDLMGYAVAPMLLNFNSAFVAEVKKLVKADHQVGKICVNQDTSWGVDGNNEVHCRNMVTRFNSKTAPWRSMVASVMNAPQGIAESIAGFDFEGIKRFSEMVDLTSPYAAPHHISVTPRGGGFVVRSASLSDAFGVIVGVQHPALPSDLPDWGEVAIGARAPQPIAQRPPAAISSTGASVHEA